MNEETQPELSGESVELKIAKSIYEVVLDAIGRGFHPDNPMSSYVNINDPVNETLGGLLGPPSEEPRSIQSDEFCAVLDLMLRKCYDTIEFFTGDDRYTYGMRHLGINNDE